jgi:hypothetical protein
MRLLDEHDTPTLTPAHPHTYPPTHPSTPIHPPNHIHAPMHTHPQAAPTRRTHAHAPTRRTHAHAPTRRTHAHAPTRRTHARAPTRRTHARAPTRRTHAHAPTRRTHTSHAHAIAPRSWRRRCGCWMSTTSEASPCPAAARAWGRRAGPQGRAGRGGGAGGLRRRWSRAWRRGRRRWRRCSGGRGWRCVPWAGGGRRRETARGPNAWALFVCLGGRAGTGGAGHRGSGAAPLPGAPPHSRTGHVHVPTRRPGRERVLASAHRTRSHAPACPPRPPPRRRPPPGRWSRGRHPPLGLPLLPLLPSNPSRLPARPARLPGAGLRAAAFRVGATAP